MDRPSRGTGRRRWAAWTEVDRAVPPALPASDAAVPVPAAAAFPSARLPAEEHFVS
ncbi:hypothetical protein GTX07_33085 [Streptomyces sp. SID5606]|nr:hypothetical protein [Streptomyces sp. SID5606]